MPHKITRRSFAKHSTTLIAAAAASRIAAPSWAVPGITGEKTPPWYANVYRRAVIDMHIPDWDERFLSKFDPAQYAEALVKSRSQSVVCYCQSHVGLFNYPTKIGKQHEGWKGRNAFQEMIDAVHQRGIHVQAYTSLIFDRWCGDEHPDWMMRDVEGQRVGINGRHRMLCINSPYRDYVRSWVQEICEEFDFEGIRFDMTFWPAFCYCQFCQQRFDEEVGGPLPTVVDWLDPAWVAFQRARERWLIEFAAIATETVKRFQPDASIEHQSSTFPQSYRCGVTGGLAKQNTFLQGDFYGSALQGSFVRKLLSRMSPHEPFGYETSASVRLQDHTAVKPAALLEAKVCSAIADNAAFVFIDAIDPIGTVHSRPHEQIGMIHDRLMPFYSELGGQRVADVGIFYSFESKCDLADNGTPLRSLDDADSHTEAAMAAASQLLGRQRLLSVLTKDSLEDLPDIKVLVLNNVNMMDVEECEAIRDWVHQGGKLLATGGSSLVDKSGKLQDDFMLADVFGASLKRARWNDWHHYLSPTKAGAELFPYNSPDYPAFSDQRGHEIEAHGESTVLATLTLPWRRQDRSRFSSIHSDPPWMTTDQPEIVTRSFGKGQVVYCASVIENLDVMQETFVRLVELLNRDYRLQAEAPACIEATLFRQTERQRYRLSLVNFQAELPNLPVRDVKIRLQLDESVQAIRLLPTGEPVPFQQVGTQVHFAVPTIETLQMFEVTYS